MGTPALLIIIFIRPRLRTLSPHSGAWAAKPRRACQYLPKPSACAPLRPTPDPTDRHSRLPPPLAGPRHPHLWWGLGHVAAPPALPGAFGGA